VVKLVQKTVDDGCAAARERYNTMKPVDAQKQFSYDLQGFLASMNDRKEWPLAKGIQKVAELLNIIATRNGI
jgi:hypothetical protein